MSNYRLTTRGKIVVTLLLVVMVLVSFSYLSREKEAVSDEEVSEDQMPGKPAPAPQSVRTESPQVGSIDPSVGKVTEKTPVRQETSLPPFEQKKILVYFGPDNDALRDSAQGELSTFIDVAEETPWMIRVDSHINGYPDYNDSEFGEWLSRERGQVVARFLIASGIDEERLILYSHGSSDPIHDRPVAEELARNRRVEIQFVFQTVDKTGE